MQRIPPQLVNFPTLTKLMKLHISSVLATLLLWTQFKDADGHTILVVPSMEQSSSCARGFLLLWDLADIEHRSATNLVPRPPLHEYVTPLEDPNYSASKVNHSSHRLLNCDSIPWLRKMREEWRTSAMRVVLGPLMQFRRRRLLADGNLHALRDGGTVPDAQSEKRNKAKACLTEKLEYVDDIDQGAWADMQAAVAASLTFYNLYMCDILKGADRRLPDNDMLRQSIEWLVRQGPELLLSMLSRSVSYQRNARRYIEDNWLSIAPSERLWQSELYGNSWDAHETRPDYDLRALLLRNSVIYKHSRQEEWTTRGYPKLWDCVIETLRQWSTFDLYQCPEAVPLARRLRTFKNAPK